MMGISAIRSDPSWIPHKIDELSGRVTFIKVTRETTERHGFLANLDETEPAISVRVDELSSIEMPRMPVHFIFHSGFCRSTLLLRAMQSRHINVCLNEPEILNSLARLSRPDQKLVDTMVALLGRQRVSTETVIVKASNFPNRLIPQLLRSSPQARGLIIANCLPEFLRAVVRKGLQGRQWARQAYLVVSTYAGKVDQYDKLLPSLTDLQVAGLGWLLTQNWFAKQYAGPQAQRLTTLHSHKFNEQREETIAKATRHFGIEFNASKIGAIIDSHVFKQDAKLGGDFAAKAELDETRSQSPVVDEEIATVSKWVQEIARVTGLTVPVPQTLY